MKCGSERFRLYAVTDSAWVGKQTLEEQVEEALKHGVTFVQLREKHKSREHILKQAVVIRDLCRSYGVPFVINDDVELALSCDADGVHVGQEDLQAGEARKRLGPGKLLGVSAHTLKEALEAERNGADYLGVGAVFQTATKTDATAMSYETLRAICEGVQIPVVAIGGIGLHNLHRLAGSGIDGVAVVSAIFGAENIKEATKQLREAVEEIISRETAEKAVSGETTEQGGFQ